MKLLIVALCLAAGSNIFVRCEIDIAYLNAIDDNGEGTVDGEALMGMEQSNKIDDLNITQKVLTGNNTLASAKLLDGLDDLDIGGRALRGDHDDNTLKFGDRGQYVAKMDDVLGEGFNGKVYKANDTTTGRQVAVKTELMNARRGTLLIESANYESIGRHRGFPIILYSGKSPDGQSNILVMQMLRNSLADLQKQRQNNRFSPKTVYMIGIQLMHRIETLHRERFVHRDIKPGNFGIGGSGQQIYIFDFGNSKKYGGQGKHFPEGNATSYGSGTPRYMSAYSHSHLDQSRRDDMEAIGFMLMSFLRGDLPWDAVRDYKQPAYKSQVVSMKQNLDFNEFCKGYASQMVDYFKHVRNELEFNTRPNYSLLRKLFRTALSDMGETEDKNFDWPTK